MWIAHFMSESGDNYYAGFEKKPTDYELKVWMVYHFSHEIDDGTIYVRLQDLVPFPKFYGVDEGDLEQQGFPMPEDLQWL